MTKPRKTLILSIFAFVFAGTFTFLALRLPRETSAASLENFRPGNIISDYTMSNVNTMSVSDIQSFLSSKGNCNDTATAKASYYPSLHYHIENGHFVCLADERFATSGTNYGDLLAPDEASQTAAEIIYEVAHEYTINPQVLLVLLQKEQGLLTDSWPNNRQYRSATGYGCPDTAACDSKYYGFKNQLRNAASLFRTVLDGGWTNYPLGNNYIYYNPDRSCGGSTVYIENLATSSLYRYTPYQPNSGALSAGYGTATCGAYGNRNFYLYFLDYFGDPTKTITVTSVQKEAKEKIDEKYKQTTNAETILGSKIAFYPNCNIGHDGACVQAYQKGIIITTQNGDWLNYGDIRDRFVQVGSIDSRLGLPTSDPNCNIGHDGACVQAFENGVIISNPTTGTWESYGEIRTRFVNNGSVDGFFGFPTTGIECEKDICYQDYENKAILKDSEEKYWVSIGSIAERYKNQASHLGAAIMNVNCNIGHDGACVQAFENGVIIYGPKTGTWENYGNVRAEYIKQGSVDGFLGFPTSGIENTIQHFENGSISL